MRLFHTNHTDEPHHKLDNPHLREYNASMPGSIEYLTLNESNALLKAIDDTRDFAIVTLFLNTTKGKVKELSDRAVDKLIRKYAQQAGIRKKVNAQILRNTFAVRFVAFRMR
jgi:hypothetical protein